ncbi:target of Nesh-SH3 isoform X2 [Scomber scombrus]|uniref:Target of Nesh-SH3 isoform X2 n=1 Tax=Scomber scombrus TaxID=13677 RepID=A0AAV1NK37_SCOSC
MQQHSHSFMVLLIIAFIAGIVLSSPSAPRRSRVRRQNMKVRISASGDTIVMKFLRPNTDTKLEGYILGYGSSMFSKQFIQLPENGQPYETEFDAEPKYLIAVQPIPTNEVKKQCTGKVELEKPLHLVIGSVTPTSVLLSWGTLLKTPYEGNVMNDCLEDGHYTVRYRERNRKWNYQTCPTSETVIDNLKPNTVYEFGVQPSTKDGTGVWSKPVIHNISTGGAEEKAIRKFVKRPVNPVKPLTPGPQSFPFPPRHVLHNSTQGRVPVSRNIAPKTTFGGGDLFRSVLPPPLEVPLPPKPRPTLHISATMASVPDPQTNVEKHGGYPLSQSQQNPQSQPHTQPQPKPQLQPHYRPQHQPKPHHPKPCSTSQPLYHHQPEPKPQPTSQTTVHNLSKSQTQPQPPLQPILQTLSQTQSQPTSQSIPQTLSQTQPLPTSQFIPHTQPQSQPQASPQPQRQTQTQSQSQPKPHTQSQPQTTPQLQSQPQPHSTTQPKHHIQQQTQPQLKTQTKPQLQVQPTSKPTFVAHPKTLNSTPQHLSQTQALPKTHTKPQPQPQLQSTTLPQTQTHPQPVDKFQPTFQPQPQPKTDPQSQPQPQPKPKPKPKPKKPRQSKAQPPKIPQPKNGIFQPKPKTQPQSKNKTKTRTRDPQQSLSRPGPPSHPSAKSKVLPIPYFQLTSQPQLPPMTQTQSHSEPLPKSHPTSRPRPQLQPGLQFQPKTRNHSTPRQGIPTAPSPPEEGKPLPRPALATENAGTGVIRSSNAEVPRFPISSSDPPAGRNTTLSRNRVHSPRNGVRPFSPPKTFPSSHSSSTPGADGTHHRGNAVPKPEWSKDKPVLRPSIPVNKKTNLVGKPSEHDKPMDRKQGDKESILKPFPLVTAKPKQERRQPTTTSAPALNSSRFDLNDNSSVFSSLPASELDIMGKKRFVAPHVVYKTDKKPNEPCSITSSLAYFPDDEEGSDLNVTGPPRVPPSNLTVMTVEGCPSFVILDWQKSDNETREYEVISKIVGPHGEEVSILTTNQTHTAVENLKPESSYEFQVTPKNELGSGPSSDPVSFSTESADPRVSEHVSGKDAIWTQFPFKTDAYSECNGKQYVKRTWYRKFVGIQLCNSLRYKIYLSDSLNGKFYNIGDQAGHGEDHCQFVDSFLDGRTGTQMLADQLPGRQGFYRAMRQEPVAFGEIGGKSHATYVGWYECGTPIPGKW